jgi:hypothetical protein
MDFSWSQTEQYKEEGYTVVRGLLSAEEAGPLRQRLLDIFHGNHDWPRHHFQVLDPSKFRHPTGGLVPWGVQLPAKRELVFREIADHPNLQTVMTRLLGGPVERFTDQALIKSPGINGHSFYHQDSYYWRLEPGVGCNAWIALDTVGKDSIAPAILPGTHRSWTLAPHEEYYDEPTFHGPDGHAFKRLRIPLSEVDHARERVLELLPGDAVFFTNFTWHRAEVNRSGQHKCAYAVAYRRISPGRT